MASSSDGWPKFIKDFDEWRERTAMGGGGAKRFFADWMDARPDPGGNGNGNGWRSRARSAGQPLVGDIGALLSERDPWTALVKTMGERDNQHRLFVGTNGAAGGIWTTEPRRNLLVLGPPRTAKTVGCERSGGTAERRDFRLMRGSRQRAYGGSGTCEQSRSARFR
jgi:hypothetical protein